MPHKVAVYRFCDHRMLLGDKGKACVYDQQSAPVVVHKIRPFVGKAFLIPVFSVPRGFADGVFEGNDQIRRTEHVHDLIHPIHYADVPIVSVENLLYDR